MLLYRFLVGVSSLEGFFLGFFFVLCFLFSDDERFLRCWCFFGPSCLVSFRFDGSAAPLFSLCTDVSSCRTSSNSLPWSPSSVRNLDCSSSSTSSLGSSFVPSVFFSFLPDLSLSTSCLLYSNWS